MTVKMQFRGQSSKYIDLAERDGQTLGISLQYASYKGVACIIVRFVTYGKDLPYTHFVVREKSSYIRLDEQGEDMGEPFDGSRLNKVLIPMFAPYVPKKDLETFVEKFGLAEKLSNWITEQVNAEGMKLLYTNLAGVVKGILQDEVNLESVQEITSPYPSLVEQKEEWLKYLAAKHSHGKEEENDEDDEDEDEKPKNAKKSKVN